MGSNFLVLGPPGNGTDLPMVAPNFFSILLLRFGEPAGFGDPGEKVKIIY